jgi:hypothetical protein
MPVFAQICSMHCQMKISSTINVFRFYLTDGFFSSSSILLCSVFKPIYGSLLGLLLFCLPSSGQGISSTSQTDLKIIDVDSGWAGNSVNTVVFRKNALVTFESIQFISFYNKDGYIVLGKRKLGTTNWELKTTIYKGDIRDAHNSISIMADGDGHLHLAWTQHNGPLNYCKSIEPLSLEMTEKLSMTGDAENSVTYPEFYKMPNGNLLFFYRDGGSGNGNLVLNRYDYKTARWVQLYKNLIDGEGKRNAYWQACVDVKGVIHISWVWRESPDVASNHDICYACSKDEGLTWEKSTGEKYNIPINASTAEYVCNISQKSELINQTSMYADENGNPFIATYWRESGDSIPQYHVLYKIKNHWQIQNLGFRTTAFSLSGGGTKNIPVSRPQIVVLSHKRKIKVVVVFRDKERGDHVSLAINKNIIKKNRWMITDLTKTTTGEWEPTYDTELWKQAHRLDLFVQKVEQADAEGLSKLAPQMVQVIEWLPGII